MKYFRFLIKREEIPRGLGGLLRYMYLERTLLVRSAGSVSHRERVERGGRWALSVLCDAAERGRDGLE